MLDAPPFDPRTRVREVPSVKDRGHHATFVDTFFAHGGTASPELVMARLEAGLAVVWARTRTMLGEMTLTVIAERVVWNAGEQFPFLTALEVDPSRGIVCDRVLERLGPGDAAHVDRGARVVLVELLTVLGNLTAELLTEELHAELAKLHPLGFTAGAAESKEPSANGSGSATS